jgi:hypothetical protein
MSVQPQSDFDIVLRAPGAAIRAVRHFFVQHPDSSFIAAYVGKVCGLQVLPTLAALAFLLEAGEIRVEVSASSMSWSFSSARRPR